jgi:protein-disulfide isomerase
MKSRIKFLGMVLSIWTFAFHVNQGIAAEGAKPAAPGNDVPAFKVYGVVKPLSELVKTEQSAYYEIEKRKYEMIEDAAKDAFLKKYWEDMAKKQNTTPEKAQDKYLSEKIKISAKEVKEVLERFKDHPQLSKLSKDEQEKQVKEYLRERDRRTVIDVILEDGIKSGNLAILYPKPEEPIENVSLTEHDVVRYGPKETDTKPINCKANDCPITVVEYSEFQCHFCGKVVDDTRKVLDTYKGKIRWVVRDFPLDFHPRAIPAAVAAKCASFQGKYWDMYYKLFANQKSLEDKDLEKYAADLKLNQNEFKKCVANPDKAKKIIASNFESGKKLNVTGTPAFFVNGRRLSGALPFAEFKKIIDEELSKKKG